MVPLRRSTRLVPLYVLHSKSLSNIINSIFNSTCNSLSPQGKTLGIVIRVFKDELVTTTASKLHQNLLRYLTCNFWPCMYVLHYIYRAERLQIYIQQ